jgi:hypothetical protein
MEYQVGQILYICNEKNMNIYPIQIVEEVVRTTLNGKEKTYLVMLPDKEKTTFDIAKVKDNLFDSIDLVKDHMITNATNAINKMSHAAVMLSKEAFNIKEAVNENIVIQNDKHVQVETNNDIIMVDLGNGVKAKMNTNNLEKVAGQ